METYGVYGDVMSGRRLLCKPLLSSWSTCSQLTNVNIFFYPDKAHYVLHRPDYTPALSHQSPLVLTPGLRLFDSWWDASYRVTPPCSFQPAVVNAVGSRGQCWTTDGVYMEEREEAGAVGGGVGGVVERLEEAEGNVHLSALSLTMITPFELAAFTGSRWFCLTCATSSGRQLGFGEKAKSGSCPCSLCFCRSTNADWSDDMESNKHAWIFYFSVITGLHLTFYLHAELNEWPWLRSP